jgi:hypothetical protein
METLDIIDRLPFELAARLECDPFFRDIPVVVAEAGNIKLEMERKQAVTTEKSGKRGVAVIVLQIVAEDPFKNIQFAPMQLNPAFQVVENVEMNNDDDGTKKSHRKVARRIRDVIKHCVFAGLVQDMKAGKPCIEPVDLSDIGKTIKASQVNFECLEVSGEAQTLVQMPIFTGDANGGNPQLTIASATPGAAIWFTTDDKFPYNGDKDIFPGSTAQLYTGPIPIPAEGFVVRACTYLDEPGAVASGINRATIKYSL